MKTRILALLCLLAVFLGVFSLAVLPAQASDEAAYLVGYSKKDTNPWADPEDHDKGFLLPDKDENGEYIIDADGNYKDGIPLAGYGSVQTRPALEMLDDNGNDVVDDNDGLFATCTAVTDTKGTTMMFITLDAISPAAATVKTLRANITAAIRALEGEMYADQIMISGSHSHTGPDLYTLSAANEKTNPKQHQYYQYYINQVVSAAVDAYEGRSPAEMTKTTIDASEVLGVQMNYIRHFSLDAQIQYVINGNIVDTNADPSLVSGANFGQFHTYTKWEEPFALWTDSNGNCHELRANVENQQHIDTADSSMDLLKFEVEGSNEPIVLINWQAHPDNIGKNYVSSDYIGGLRYRLEKNTEFGGVHNYRVAFFQGASGNLVVSSHFSKNDWYDLPVGAENDGLKDSTRDVPFITYGYLLAKAALSALEGNSAIWSDPITGAIKTKQLTYIAEQQTYSEGLRAAANAYYTDKADGVINNDADGAMPSVDSKYKEFPYAYDHSDGKRYIINSSAHASKIKNPPHISTLDLELNAILIGDGLAIVTAPVELSDRYNNETLEYLGDNIANDWDKLIGATYGAPMVLGYTNNHLGYIANQAAYHYNENAVIKVNGVNMPIFATGSYEANTSYYAEGTGEKLMDVFAQLLKEAATEETGTSGYCDACQKTVDWKVLDFNSLTASPDLRSGHYRLAGDVTVKDKLKVIPGNTVCLDLNGSTLDYNRSTMLTVGGDITTTEDAVLNLFDTQGGGKLAAPNRVVYVGHRGKVNMYGGAIEGTAETAAIDHGGAVYVTHDDAVFNLYGGTIRGGNVTEHGGAVYLWSEANETKAQFNIYGGAVIGGSAKNGAAISCLQSQLGLYGGSVLQGTLTNAEGAAGDCIYTSSSPVYFSGSGYADSITCDNFGGNTLYLSGDTDIRIPGGITYSEAFESDVDLGNSLNGAKLLSSLVVYDNTDAQKYLAVSGSDLKPKSSDPTTENVLFNGQPTTLSQAIANYTLSSDVSEITAIRLTKDIDTLTADKDVCIDLNGHSIASVNITGNATLYVMDSTTNDYNIPDLRCCGYIGAATGNVQPVPDGFGCVESKEGNWYSGYVKLNTEQKLSFHRIDFGIADTDMSMEKAGIRYGCNFYASNLLCDAFTGSYGIVVSIKGDPAPNGVRADHAASTSFRSLQNSGNAASNSYITNILKEENGYVVNKRNGETQIRGRAYFQFEEDGPIFYGPEKTSTFKDALKQADDNWESIAFEPLKKQTYEFFNTFKSVMKKWDLPNIEAGAAAEEDAVLKVLTIGNSHAIDAMTMLYEVYQKENPGKKVELGILYYSGCHVDRHILHIQNDYPAYQYYKINDEIMTNTGKWQVNGTFSTPAKLPDWQDMDNVVISSIYNKDNPVTDNTELVMDGWTIDMALADEKWDVIVLQQMNNHASDEYWYTRKAYSNNLTDLEWLIRYIKLNAQGAPKLGFHVTWANPMTDSEKSGYVNTTTVPDWKSNMEKWYGNNNGDWSDENRITMQHTMFEKIRTCTKKYIQPLVEDGTLSYLFFSGPAVQHAFDNAIQTDTAVVANENIYRDYTHMSHYGRLLAAYTWYAELEGLTSLSQVKVDTIPAAILHPHDKSTLDLTGPVYNKQLLMDAVNYAINYNYTLPWS